MLLSVLRPRAAALVRVRLFSSAVVRRSDAFTLAVSAGTTKGSVLDVLRERKASPNVGDNAAVVLVSPGLAGWLEDKAFMSGLLRQLPLRTDATVVSVLSAVVDGVGRYTSAGLSIAHGSADKLLPGLWQQRDVEPSRGTLNDVEAAITFELPMRTAPTDSPLSVTVPLANTVFQNGRRSTLLASRWSWQTNTYELAQLPATRTHQVVVLPVRSSAWPVVPLVAATKPRTIVAGLGNIVRQVEDDDGQPMPASRELESTIPALLAARRKDGPTDYDDSAVGVWGLVVPADVWPLYTRLQHTLMPLTKYSMSAETQAAVDGTDSLAQLLAAGCRLHRILSGGGGWGKKQGLLSLDPETGYAGRMGEQTSDSDSDDAAMDRFMRSLRGETEAQDGDSLAQPGARVQFFVAPLAMDVDGLRDGSLVTVDLGVQASESAHRLQVERDDASVQLVSGFGAVSSRGLFLEGGSAHTKVDVPASAVWA